jgi:PAS domain S-box-containing protein
MTAAPEPADEAVRLGSLRALGILDTPAEERFDRITRIASRLFDVPIVLVSLVDANRQWFKSCLGLEVRATPRTASFCAHAILDRNPLVIPDATADERFADNPLVLEDPHIRFYAGRPLAGPDGRLLGTLCVIDRRPRTFSQGDLAALDDLAAWAEREIASAELGQALAARRESEARIEAILGSAADAILAVDGDGRVAYANAKLCELLGQDARRVRGLAVQDLLRPARGATGPAADALVGRDTAGAEAWVLATGGEEVCFEYSCAAVTGGGPRGGTVITMRDVSERREIERMRDELVGALSHELRTPLTSVRGYAEGLLEEGRRTLGPDQLDDINAISRNARRIEELVDDLLLIARLRAGAQEPDVRRVDLTAVASAVADDCSGAPGPAVAVELPSSLRVAADPHQLAQALGHLVRVARGSRGVQRVVVAASDTRGSLVLTVTAVGGAPPPSGHGTSTTGGPVLALAVAGEVARLHGWTLEIDRALRETRFHLVLPAGGGPEE